MYKWLFSRKYHYFNRKVRDVQNSIWEYEFKVTKSRAIREGIRGDRDRAMQSIANMEEGLKTIPAEQKGNLEQELERAKENVTRYEAQMKMIDDQINGGAQTQENPAGIGILEQIKSLTELKLMYLDYCSKL